MAGAESGVGAGVVGACSAGFAASAGGAAAFCGAGDGAEACAGSVLATTVYGEPESDDDELTPEACTPGDPAVVGADADEALVPIFPVLSSPLVIGTDKEINTRKQASVPPLHTKLFISCCLSPLFEASKIYRNVIEVNPRASRP
jgi:hypothetical protein